MARITYDIDQPAYNGSAGYYHPGFNDNHRADYYHPRSNGSYALLAIVIVLVLFFWTDLPRLRSNLGSWLRDSPNSMTIPAQGSTIRTMTETRYVTMDNLNMREKPSIDAPASYILARGTRVALLGESHRGLDGSVWLKVNVETLEGMRVGWVSQQYVE